MHDWQELVRTRLKQNGRKTKTPDDVVAELAAHLEEIYEQSRSQGLSDAVATALALKEAGDWRALARNIRRLKRKENSMNYRTKTLWLPALLSLFGSASLLMILQQIHSARFEPHLVWIAGIGMMFYWPWLAGLPLFGALGAYLSCRAHGRTFVRLAAGLSPALVMLIAMSLILPWGLAVDGFSFFRLVAFGMGLTNWVVVPGLALLLGTLPFLRDPRRTTSEA